MARRYAQEALAILPSRGLPTDLALWRVNTLIPFYGRWLATWIAANALFNAVAWSVGLTLIAGLGANDILDWVVGWAIGGIVGGIVGVYCTMACAEKLRHTCDPLGTDQWLDVGSSGKRKYCLGHIVVPLPNHKHNSDRAVVDNSGAARKPSHRMVGAEVLSQFQTGWPIAFNKRHRLDCGRER